MPVQKQFFLGFLLNAEIKAHLAHSRLWKEALLDNQATLQKGYQQDSTYIGLSLLSFQDIKSLKESEKEIRRQLLFYCPKLNLSNHSSYLFIEVLLT